jgi:hypothetical protein
MYTSYVADVSVCYFISILLHILFTKKSLIQTNYNTLFEKRTGEKGDISLIITRIQKYICINKKGHECK